MNSRASKNVNVNDLPRRILFGAAYYAEYQPYERLATDLDLMAEAGFSVIRVGESVWSTWEPEDGRFELDWLQPVLDEAHARDISVIIGTPTYAVPPWLRRKYPETAAHRATGRPAPYGGRQDADFSHPAFRYLAERVIRKIVPRYADHPAVIGWQVDNEPGMEILHNPAVFQGFVDHLRTTYGDVGTLNDRWGLTYWSHRISEWSQLWTPDGNTTPSYDLAWRRYQADLTTDFIGWQARIVRELAAPGHFVTTCVDLGRKALDEVALGRELDVAATNIYFPMQDGLRHPAPEDPSAVGRPWWLPWSGAWALYLKSDLSYGIRREPFLVTETHAQSIGESHVNYPAYDGQWRQAVWAMVARGASAVEYWHWHTLHFGLETHWGGVLGHSLQPGRCYGELSRTGAELRQAGETLAGLEPDADVAILYSLESKWALEFQPPIAAGTSGDPDRSAYDRVVATLHQGLFDAGLQAAVLSPRQLGTDAAALAARWPVLVVPALYVASDELLELLEQYARHGGHLLLTFRSGYADEEARPRPRVMPGVLREAVGAHYLEYTNLAEPVRVTGPDGGFDGRATAWADALVPDTAKPLAMYDHPHLGRWPAAVTNEHGSGRVTYLGTLPDAALASRLARWVAETTLPEDPWHARPASVTVTGARAADGRRLRFVSNWSWETAPVRLPVPATDLLSGEALEAGSEFSLGAWDVRVLVERDTGITGNRQEERR
ncbi:beta-galactosidase [Streptomyces sp. NBC_00988]|uniref:beta-galactosidase n=1 Tax=Streptomyces sp. NBC_00988 TaxID=2903704 RepID=UPI003870C512|nr:beta-galactosidase [Streptomyces sp. NBC_00988]